MAVLFWGDVGGVLREKSALCTLVVMITIMDRPLKEITFGI